MGHDPALIPHLVTLHNDAMGCCDPRLIRVEGEKVGEEKKDFEISYFGSGSKYDDFEPPSFSADLCEVVEDQLHLSLTVDDEVTKVEVSVDGNCLNQIVIGGFDDIYLDLDSLEVNVGTEVLVYAYDQYLNYSVEDVTGWVGVRGPEMEVVDIDVFPNPAVDVLRIRYRIPDAGYRIPVTRHASRVTRVDLYMSDGKKIRELERKEVGPDEHEMKIDVSDLPAGTYLLRLQVGRDVVLKKLVKMER
jgi:hypothetical protein